MNFLLSHPVVRSCCVVAATVVIVISCSKVGKAQEIESADESSSDVTSLDSFADEMSVYTIRQDDSDSAFEFRRAPVLRWSNPVKNDQQGAVFVWMEAGRPQVVGSTFHFSPSGRAATIQEFHSLASGPWVATRDGKEFWRPRSALEFSRLERSPVPAASASARQLQMRGLSRRVTAQMTDEKRSVTQLRLIARPLISYQPDNVSDRDGAMFALAAGGTDPDAFLLIENRTLNGQPAWYFAFVRFHFNELAAQIDGSEVWRAAPKLGLQSNFLGSKKYRDDLYLSIRTY